MLACFLIFISSVSIPEQFNGLIKKLITNSNIKIPKNERESTKYPGKYTYQNAHFNLLKTLTSSRTRDIKAHAIENNFAAILKRKIFNLTEGFTFLDYQSQKFYLMEEIVASDEKINIYKIKSIEMFHIFSDLEFNGKSPLLSYDKDFNWDKSKDYPNLINLDLLSVGPGSVLSVSCNTKVHLISIKKAEIATDITLNGKVGTRLKVGKTKYVKYKDNSVIDDKEIFIPGLSTTFRFLGLTFDFQVLLTFGAIIKHFEANVQADVDYFKGYQFSAKRFISIKCNGISDSDWQTDFSPIPSNHFVDGDSSNLEANKLSGIIDIKQGIRIKAIVSNNIQADLRFGLLESFAINFDYGPLVCPFPYLYGNFELTLNSYLSFSGIELDINLFEKNRKYKLLNEINKNTYPFQYLKTRKYCLFDSRNNKDHTVTGIDDYQDDNEEESDDVITLEINNLKNLKQTNSFISFKALLNKYDLSTNEPIQLFNSRSSSYDDLSAKKSNFDQIIVADEQNKTTSKVTFIFSFLKGINIIEYSNSFSFFLKDYAQKKDEYNTITIYNPDKTEEVSFNFRIDFCEKLPINEMYIPTFKNGIITKNFQLGDQLCLIAKDINSNLPDYVDENAIFTTDGTLSRDLISKGIFVYKDEYFIIKLVDVRLPYQPTQETYVNYEVRAEWGNNYQEKVLVISNYTNQFNQGTNRLNDDCKSKVRINASMRLFITISYVQSFNVDSMKQEITYSEIVKAANSNEKTIVKTQPNNKISFTISIERYKPLVLVNCSKSNSTHRIITNIYILNSATSSDYKPQEITFKDNLMYGVFQLKRIHKNIKWVIIHMPMMQPLCDNTMISDEYYQIPIDRDIIYIPFRKENTTMTKVTINHVIQGNFVDDETVYFANKYYSVNFDETPVVLAFIRTINNQYSIAGIERTKQTLIDYGNEFFKILALSYEKEKKIIFASSLIIIDQNTPFIEKEIPSFPNSMSVVYHVWCQRADAIMIHDKTANITIENNTMKSGEFFKLIVTPGHIIDFIPVCNNLSQPMCYFKHKFFDPNGYAVFRYPNKNGITILDPSINDLFEQKDRQGLIEEVIKKENDFYYTTSFEQPIQILRTYEDQLDLELRIIDVTNEYKKFCVVDRDGHFIPVSRSFYTDYYNQFIDEFGIQNNIQYYDFTSGEDDSCLYAKYTIKDDQNNISNKNILSKNIISIKSLPNTSSKICDIAKSIKVLYYQDIKLLVPPAKFSQTIYTVKKVFEDDWVEDDKILKYEIAEYFTKAKIRITPEDNNSIFCLYLPYNELRYNNTLQKDEYISANKNIIIHFIDGNLNYILPENAHTIIDIGDKNETILNLNGKGSLEFKSLGQSAIKILGELNLDSIKTIRVSNNVKLVEIETVNIANYTELHVLNEANEVVELKIENLTLFEHSKANLSNVEISNRIIIKQTATAFVDHTVKFSNSELFIEMLWYQNDLIPMISGELPDPPKKIYIQRSIENQGPKKEEEYKFFDGKFDCELWTERLDFGDSFFNNVRCSYMNNTEENLLSLEAIGIFISFVEIVLSIVKDYCPGMGIAGIVFFCLGALLAIPLVFLIICHRSYTCVEASSEM